MTSINIFVKLLLLGALLGTDPVSVLAQESGSITGVIDHPIMRRMSGAVYIAEIDGKSFAPSTVNPVMDQINIRYTPHVLPVLAGSTIDFPNSDDTRHHVYTSTSSVCQFELGLYDTGVVKHVTCDEPGVVMLLCNVHAEMRGIIVVVSTPYFAATETDGSFLIEGIPPGSYTLIFEHERLSVPPLEITVTAGNQTAAIFGKPGRKRRSNP